MAVAEKKTVQETHTTTMLDRVPVMSLVGVVFVLACFAIVFKLVPDVWRHIWGGLGLNASSFTAMTLMVLVILAAAVGLIVLGNRLLGPKPKPGVRAGVLFGLLFFLGVLLLARWVSLWVEHWVYYDRWFGESGPMVGMVLTILAGAAFLFLAVRWFLKPSFERTLVGFEGAGWLSTGSYKPQQGQKVRRGTILGILLILGAGIYTMVSHNVLARGTPSWEIGIPFTGTIEDIAPNDARQALEEKYGDKWETNGVPSYEFRKFIDQFDPSKNVRIDSPTDIGPVKDQDTGKLYVFTPNQIVPRSEIVELKKKLSDEDREKLPNVEEARKRKEATALSEAVRPVVVPASPPTGRMELASLTVLPHVQFTLPFVLLALALWFAWRVVNLPAFADFLIATEAELNKVSWTTRRRLFQDTIVVLTTLVLMAALLFGMDQLWLHLLSWKRVGVIYQEDTQSKTTKGERPEW